MPIDAAVIQTLGWRQGSIFTLDASTPIVIANRDRISVPQFIIPDDARLILVSHDCDIVHAGPHEPRVEVCPAVPISALSGNFTGTRNPRRLHIEMEIDGARRCHELRAPTRFVIPREALQLSAPDSAARLTPEHHRHFCHWLAKRVRRTALPTEFDARVSKQTRSAIRNILNPLAGGIHSLLIAIDPSDQELGPEDGYAVQVVALMENDDFLNQQMREAVEGAMKGIEALLDGCEGIELDACICQSTAAITLDEYVAFSPWDYDDLSLEAGAVVPQQAP